MDGCLVVDLTGTLDEFTYVHVRDQLIQLALEQPRAVVVNLDGIRVASESLLTVFSVVRIRTSDWPDVPIRLVAAERTLREVIAAGAIGRVLPVHETVGGAIASLVVRAHARRGRVVYRPVAENSAAARKFVHQACHEWGVAGSAPDAVCVITELVENAVVHAQTEFEVGVELGGDRLSLAVRDGDPALAVLRSGCMGLRLVDALAKSWGCAPDLRGGKVTWATLETGEHWLAKYPPWRSPTVQPWLS